MGSALSVQMKGSVSFNPSIRVARSTESPRNYRDHGFKLRTNLKRAVDQWLEDNQNHPKLLWDNTLALALP